MLLAELSAVAEEFAAGLGGGGLFELLEEERSERGGGDWRFGEEFLDLVLAFGVESAGLEGGDLFAEVIALEAGGEELLFEAGDLGRGGGVEALAECLCCGGVNDRVNADHIADRLDGGAIDGALSENDM